MTCLILKKRPLFLSSSITLRFIPFTVTLHQFLYPSLIPVKRLIFLITLILYFHPTYSPFSLLPSVYSTLFCLPLSPLHCGASFLPVGLLDILSSWLCLCKMRGMKGSEGAPARGEDKEGILSNVLTQGKY